MQIYKQSNMANHEVRHYGVPVCVHDMLQSLGQSCLKGQKIVLCVDC